MLYYHPHEVSVTLKKTKTSKHVRGLSAVATVAAGYGGDMNEDLACDLLDDMDFCYNRLCCRAMECMLLEFERMVKEVMREQELGISELLTG